MRAKLTEEEIRDVLARAEEIHLRTGTAGVVHSETETIIRAAEEAGLPREAVEAALRERFDLMPAPPKSGELVFAKSADGRFYVAEVRGVEPNGTRVEFVKGGSHVVSAEDIKPASFLPGERLRAYWTWWGWWPGTVLQYNAAKRKVKVDDGWGQEDWVGLDRVRLDPPKTQSPFSRTRTLVWTYALGLVSGGVLTWLGWLLFR